MSASARVESIEALKEFRASLCKFAEVVSAGLHEAEGEIQRTASWLEHDQQRYWKGQVRKRSEQAVQARILLTRKKHQKTPLGGRPSCVEEEKALAAAQRRLAEAEEKLVNVGRWRRQLERESTMYKGEVQGLSFAVEADLPKAIAQLDKMIVVLESYASVAAGQAGQEAAAGDSGSEAEEAADAAADGESDGAA